MMMNGTKTKKILFQIYVFKYIDLTQRSFEFILLQKKTCKKRNFSKSSHHFASGIASLHAFNLLSQGRRKDFFLGKPRLFFPSQQFKRQNLLKQKILCCRIMVNLGLVRLSYFRVLLYLITIRVDQNLLLQSSTGYLTVILL